MRVRAEKKIFYDQKNKSIHTTNGREKKKQQISSDSSLGTILNKRVIVSYQMPFHANECIETSYQSNAKAKANRYPYVMDKCNLIQTIPYHVGTQREREREGKRISKQKSPLICKESLLKFTLEHQS